MWRQVRACLDALSEAEVRKIQLNLNTDPTTPMGSQSFFRREKLCRPLEPRMGTRSDAYRGQIG